jgi:hypothetical protein
MNIISEIINTPECRTQGLFRRPPSAFPLSLPAKIRFVHLDFAAKEHFAIGGMGQDGGTDRVDRFICRIVGEPKLLSDLSDGEFQLEELDETQPLSGD